MRRNENARTTDHAVTIADLEELRDELQNDCASRESIDAVRDAICSAFGGDDLAAVKWNMHNAGVDAESLSPIGKVVDARVYYAHAALRKLAELLGVREVKS